jgi:hypothetical protein
MADAQPQPEPQPPPAPPARAPWLAVLALANLGAVVVGAWLIDRRLTALESRPAAHAEPAPAPAPRPGAKPKPGEPTLATLQADIEKLSSDTYEQYSDVMKDLQEIRRSTKQTASALRGLNQTLARPGAGTGAWRLHAPDQAPSAETLAQYAKDAEAAGVRVAPGRVEVRGFLNMSPNTSMPIEYFVTRWPESGHETLVHVVGNVDAGEDMTPDRLRGLVTAVYKGLVAAGFMQGKGSAWDGDPNDPEKPPKWVPPTGDKVYLGIRYVLHGATHVARATDWVVDPRAKEVLPEDAFRFTGSLRVENFQTGDEELSAEEGGLVVSVYRNPNALVEIAVPSNLQDDYAYNFRRIPKPMILVTGKDGPRLDATRDRNEGRITILGRVVDGRPPVPLEEAPVLVLVLDEKETREVPFEKSADPAGAWTARDEALSKGAEWKIRAKVDGATVTTTGVDPLYLDLVFSKTPIVPEGDGAKPVPVEVTGDEPSGMGGAPPR